MRSARPGSHTPEKSPWCYQFCFLLFCYPSLRFFHFSIQGDFKVGSGCPTEAEAGREMNGLLKIQSTSVARVEEEGRGAHSWSEAAMCRAILLDSTLLSASFWGPFYLDGTDVQGIVTTGARLPCHFQAVVSAMHKGQGMGSSRNHYRERTSVNATKAGLVRGRQPGVFIHLSLPSSHI